MAEIYSDGCLQQVNALTTVLKQTKGELPDQGVETLCRHAPALIGLRLASALEVERRLLMSDYIPCAGRLPCRSIGERVCLDVDPGWQNGNGGQRRKTENLVSSNSWAGRKRVRQLSFHERSRLLTMGFNIGNKKMTAWMVAKTLLYV